LFCLLISSFIKRISFSNSRISLLIIVFSFFLRIISFFSFIKPHSYFSYILVDIWDVLIKEINLSFHPLRVKMNILRLCCEKCEFRLQSCCCLCLAASLLKKA
jgi:hypothetical protein